MSEGREEELERAFRALRAAERHSTPEFRQVVGLPGTGSRQPGAGRRAWPPVLGWLAAGAVAVVALLLILPSRSRLGELELARQVLAWRAPTDFLLSPSGFEVLNVVPDLGRSVAGSPLAALDPGGELGPPATSRSPQ